MIKIKKPGLLSSIQDLGRYGFQKYGVIASGVMDPYAHRIANLLVGNEEKESTLEITLIGPEMVFEQDVLIAICGGDLSPIINDQPIHMWRPIYVTKGSILRFGSAKSGCRAYLAIAGGFQVSRQMASKSTYLRAGMGGYNGRALREEDQVSIGEKSLNSMRLSEQLTKHANGVKEASWSIASSDLANMYQTSTIRVMKGRQFDWFTNETKQLFANEDFKVTPQSDRMGYRLNGPHLQLENKQQMVSEAVTFGSIQVPADGKPIILMADRQTIGGYPIIAQIATVDLSHVSQSKPGERLRFEWISYQEAQQLYLAREAYMQQLANGILLKTRR
ncbi:biotin-dependent carboxyltransferase family protein [Aquibacillus sediminis]|uniref:5-oxoprolinase subunit C family protein n=1 Tax=Aquibacillus sediminis TaxID=2574734 RepID=UPI0011097BA1|nr:biotin-dependent carboxyltransferase family protein [Aquibacillus sediminis]